jgi:hypothetical protein
VFFEGCVFFHTLNPVGLDSGSIQLPREVGLGPGSSTIDWQGLVPFQGKNLAPLVCLPGWLTLGWSTHEPNQASLGR